MGVSGLRPCACRPEAAVEAAEVAVAVPLCFGCAQGGGVFAGRYRCVAAFGGVCRGDAMDGASRGRDKGRGMGFNDSGSAEWLAE